MKHTSGNKVAVESWTVRTTDPKHPSGKAVVTKIAVRDSGGRFLGPTNYRGTFLR